MSLPPNPVASRLMGAMADEDLVQSQQALSVVGFGSRSWFDPRWVPRPRPMRAAGHRFHRSMLRQRALILPRVGIDSDHRLSREILGDVGDQSVLADDDDRSLGSKRKRLRSSLTTAARRQSLESLSRSP